MGNCLCSSSAQQSYNERYYSPPPKIQLKFDSEVCSPELIQEKGAKENSEEEHHAAFVGDTMSPSIHRDEVDDCEFIGDFISPSARPEEPQMSPIVNPRKALRSIENVMHPTTTTTTTTERSAHSKQRKDDNRNVPAVSNKQVIEFTLLQHQVENKPPRPKRDKLQDRRQDVQGYRQLYNEFEAIKATVNATNDNDSVTSATAWIIDFGEYFDEDEQQSQTILLRGKDLERQRQYFERKKKGSFVLESRVSASPLFQMDQMEVAFTDDNESVVSDLGETVVSDYKVRRSTGSRKGHEPPKRQSVKDRIAALEQTLKAKQLDRIPEDSVSGSNDSYGCNIVSPASVSFSEKRLSNESSISHQSIANANRPTPIPIYTTSNGSPSSCQSKGEKASSKTVATANRPTPTAIYTTSSGSSSSCQSKGEKASSKTVATANRPEPTAIYTTNDNNASTTTDSGDSSYEPKIITPPDIQIRSQYSHLTYLSTEEFLRMANTETWKRLDQVNEEPVVEEVPFDEDQPEDSVELLPNFTTTDTSPKGAGAVTPDESICTMTSYSDHNGTIVRDLSESLRLADQVNAQVREVLSKYRSQLS